jgi:hypothetical protein
MRLNALDRLRFAVLGIALFAAAVARAAGPDFTVTTAGTSGYLFSFAGSQLNPSITLLRGHTYTFSVSASGHPFWIKTARVDGTGSSFDTGVTNNGLSDGTLTFTVPTSAPNPLFYVCQFHTTMQGTINVASAQVPASAVGWRAALLAALLVGGLAAFRKRRGLARSPKAAS